MERLAHPMLHLVPHELLGGVLSLLLVLGGLCMMVGARKLSTALIVTAITTPFISVLIEAVFNQLLAILPPTLVHVLAWCALGILYLLMFGALMGFLFGQGTWENAKGNLLAGAISRLAGIIFTWPILAVFGVVVAYFWLT